MARIPRAPQTPGAAPADKDQYADADVALEGSDAAAPAVTAAPGGPLTAADYAQMHSTEVDAKTIKRAVLCKDGWVVPDLPPQAPVRA